MDNLLKYIGGGVIGIVIIGAFFAVTAKPDTQPLEEITTPSSNVVNTLPVAGTDDYEATYRQGFISSCLSEDTTQTSYCECTYNYVKTNYTWDQRMELDRMYEAGQIPQAITDAAQSCIDYYIAAE